MTYPCPHPYETYDGEPRKCPDCREAELLAEIASLTAIVDRHDAALRYLYSTYYVTSTFEEWLEQRIEAAKKARPQ
jgi:hypothetical protein